MFTMYAVLAAVALVVVYELLRRNSRKWRLLSAFPGDYPLPIIGNGLQLGMDAEQIPARMLEMWKRHGCDNIRISMGLDDMVCLTNPDDIKILLSSSTEITKPHLYDVTRPWFGNCVLLSTGARWHTTRRFLTPLFHFSILEDYLAVANEQSNVLMKTLESKVDGPSFEFFTTVRPCLIDILTQTIMGINLEAQKNADQPYLKATNQLLDLVTRRWFSLWKRVDWMYKFSSEFKEQEELLKLVHGTCYDIINYRKKQLMAPTANVTSKGDGETSVKDKRKVCFIDQMLQSKLPNGEPVPDWMIREEADVLYFAGFDTTLSTNCFTLYHLAKFPEIQQRVIEEQKAIFGDDFLRDPTYAELGEMKYLERVIKESLRMTPTVPMFGRVLDNDMILSDGRVIPAGMQVFVFNLAVSQNPKVFKDPMTFNPDRFLEPMHPFAFTPFSAGPRNCIGMKFAWMSMKSLLSKMLRHYEVCLEGPHMEPKVVVHLILTSSNGFNLQIKKRVI